MSPEINDAATSGDQVGRPYSVLMFSHYFVGFTSVFSVVKSNLMRLPRRDIPALIARRRAATIRLASATLAQLAERSLRKR